MSLPIYTDPSKNIMAIQTNWAQQINPVIELPTNKGLILKGVQLTTGTTLVNHKLSRNLQGWFITRQRGSANIFDTQDTNQHQNLTLSLVSDADVNVDIFVF